MKRKLLTLAVLLTLISGAIELFRLAHPQKVEAAGTVEIVVLTSSINVSANPPTQTYSGVYWIPITSGLRPVTSGSAWVANGTSSGASTAQVNAINSGSILEIPWSYTYPLGTPTTTFEAAVLAGWSQWNSQINGVGPNVYYGVNYNGSTWGQN